MHRNVPTLCVQNIFNPSSHPSKRSYKQCCLTLAKVLPIWLPTVTPLITNHIKCEGYVIVWCPVLRNHRTSYEYSSLCWWWVHRGNIIGGLIKIPKGFEPFSITHRRQTQITASQRLSTSILSSQWWSSRFRYAGRTLSLLVHSAPALKKCCHPRTRKIKCTTKKKEERFSLGRTANIAPTCATVSCEGVVKMRLQVASRLLCCAIWPNLNFT